MNAEKAGKKLETTKVYLLVSTSLNVLFGVVIAYQSHEISYQAMHKKTLLQPAFPVDKPIELGWNNGEIEKSNLKKVGELISLWLMNYTPMDVQKRFYKILPFVKSDIFNEVKDMLDAESFKIKQNKITQAFHPSTITVEKEVITVRGVAVRSSVSKTLDANQIKVEIFYTYTPESGFQILSIKRGKDKK